MVDEKLLKYNREIHKEIERVRVAFHVPGTEHIPIARLLELVDQESDELLKRQAELDRIKARLTELGQVFDRLEEAVKRLSPTISAGMGDERTVAELQAALCDIVDVENKEER